MITLVNDHHGTSVEIDHESGDKVYAAEVFEVWKELCGQPECSCSDIGGVCGGTFRFFPSSEKGYYIIDDIPF